MKVVSEFFFSFALKGMTLQISLNFDLVAHDTHFYVEKFELYKDGIKYIKRKVAKIGQEV